MELRVAEKVAVTEAAALKVKVHVPVPEHGPDQPAKLKPEIGVAVRLTVVPGLKLAVHSVPQLIPAGVLVTVPLPEPFSTTVNAMPAEVKPAETEVALFMIKVHVLEFPLHAPDQPAKLPPEPGVAERVTVVPVLKVALQVDPQLIPAGLLVTVPVPLVVTVSCREDGWGCGWGGVLWALTPPQLLNNVMIRPVTAAPPSLARKRAEKCIVANPPNWHLDGSSNYSVGCAFTA